VLGIGLAFRARGGSSSAAAAIPQPGLVPLLALDELQQEGWQRRARRQVQVWDRLLDRLGCTPR